MDRAPRVPLVTGPSHPPPRLYLLVPAAAPPDVALSHAKVEGALGALVADPASSKLNQFCSREGAPPRVIGEWLPEG